MPKDGIQFQCMNMKFFMLHDRVLCIYCRKYDKSMIHRLAWLSIQIWQGWKRVLRKRHNRSSFPDSNIHGANMGPIWGMSAPDGPHVGPMNFAIWVIPSPDMLMSSEWCWGTQERKPVHTG